MPPPRPAAHLAVDVTGVGTPIVLSHGLGDDRGTWSPLVERLAAHHTVVTWDLRAHGDSEAPDDPDAYSPDIAVADLLAVLDELGEHGAPGEPVHLVGHSLGGYVSLAVALRRPRLAGSLTMIASGPGYRDAAARAAWNRYVDEAVSAMDVPPAAAGLAHQTDAWVIDHVAGLRAPLLVVVGERDARFHAGADYLGRAVRGSVVHRVTGAGHHPQRSHADDVAAMVLAHVAGAARVVPVSEM